MVLYLKQYRFSPKWYFVLGTICLCALFVRLGFWQLDRAAQNQALQARFEAQARKPFVPLGHLAAQRSLQYLPVSMTGHYDNAHTFLWDNKLHKGRVGYAVITPFVPEQGEKIVLVNRGFIAAPRNRQIRPIIPPVTGKLTVQGHIYLMLKKPLLLSTKQEKDLHFPKRIQTLDFQAMAAILQRPLYPFVVRLGKTEKGGFVREWKILAMSPDKNKGYAVQWFTFAGVLLILFFMLNVRRC